MLSLSDAKDIIHTLLEEAENYNINDAPVTYNNAEAFAWLAGRTATLHNLDKLLNLSREEIAPTEGSREGLPVDDI